MAAGINVDKINSLKVDLLNYLEGINAFNIRLDNCKVVIQSSIDGVGKSEIISKLDSIIEQIPNVSKLINTYITTLSGVVNKFEEQDQQLASQVASNINKLKS
jgi:type VII secretion effector (TIGR04197 family)